MRRASTRWSVASALLGLTTLLLSGLTTAPTANAALPGAGSVDLGPNVKVFDPSMPTSEIRAVVDAVYAQQVDAEMGMGR